MLEHVTSECSPVDVEKVYDEMLNECSECCQLCEQFGASRILKELDPTAYRCGMVDYVDSLRLIEIEGAEYEPGDVDKAQEEFIDELKSELSDLQTELDETDPEDIKEQRRINSAIVEKEQEIDDCERHQW